MTTIQLDPVGRVGMGRVRHGKTLGKPWNFEGKLVQLLKQGLRPERYVPMPTSSKGFSCADIPTVALPTSSPNSMELYMAAALTEKHMVALSVALKHHEIHFWGTILWAQHGTLNGRDQKSPVRGFRSSTRVQLSSEGMAPMRRRPMNTNEHSGKIEIFSH